MKMKNIAKSAIALLLCASMLAACADTKSKKRTRRDDDEEEETTIEETTEAPSETTETSETEETTVETTAETEPVVNDNLYENFLNNEVTVTIGSDNNFGEYLDISELYGQQLTIEQLTNGIIASLSDEYNESELRAITYSYIDCGMDGVPELILNIAVASNDTWVKTFFIKEFDGELKTIYSDLSWSRSNREYNVNGYIKEDGSAGAAVHVYDKSFIDGDGNYHFIYTDTSTTSLNQGPAYVNGSPLTVPSEYVDGEDIAFLEFDFDKDESTPSVYTFIHYNTDEFEDVIDGSYSSYFYCGVDKDESYYKEGNGLYDFYISKGVDIVSISDIDQMIADKEKAEGLTEEIKNGAPCEWQLLDYTFQPVIPGLDTENFLGRMEHFPLDFSNAASFTGTAFLIYADGTCSGSYTRFNYVENDDCTSEKNRFSGTLEVTNKVNDNVYELKMSTFELENAPGDTAVYDAAGGYKTYCTFTEIPGLESHEESTFILYCPGASKDEIDPRVIEALPEFKMEQFDDGKLDDYMLLCTVDDYSVWYPL